MSDSQVELVKQRSDIVAIIDSRVKLVKAGRNFKANCPFHGEKTPSFFVSAELQTFKCFGCGEGGDVFTFLQKYEGMNFPESLEFLAQKAGIVLKKEFRTSDEQESKRGLEILHLAGEYYRFLLTKHPAGKRARTYLSQRGVESGIIDTFGLGYASDNWQGLYDFLVTKKHYTPEEVERVGLIIRGNGGRYYDRFRGRVTFPLKDFAGKIVGFSGRLLPGEDVDEKEAKYINSPETKLYHKSHMLYGLSEVRSYIRKRNRVVVVEGEFDMISSYLAGVRETVAIKGSALTTEQVELLRRLTPNIILALDADAAGSEATKRGIRIADQMGMNLSVVEVVGGKDPDDLARTNGELWKKMIASPLSVYDFLIHKAFQAHDAQTGAGKKAISRELAPVLSTIANAVEREHYVSQAADKLAVSKKALEDEIVKARMLGGSVKGAPEPQPLGKSHTRREKLERFVMGTLLQLPDHLAEPIRLLDAELLSDRGLHSLWRQMQAQVESEPTISMRRLVANLPMESQRLVQELFSPEVLLAAEDQEKALETLNTGLSELKKIVYKEELTALSQQMSQDEELSPEAIDELQSRYAELTRKLKEIRG